MAHHPDIYPGFFEQATLPEMQFAQLWVELFPETDLHFQYPLEGHALSKWDFAHVQSKTGIEIHGGINQANSGHRSRKGVQQDMRKQQRAANLGWAYVPIASADVNDALKLSEIKRIIELRQGNG